MLGTHLESVRRIMALRLLALVLSMAASSAYAQTVELNMGGQTVQATARSSTEGLGYSVMYRPKGFEPRSYRILLVCMDGGKDAMAYCPTPAHQAVCPGSTIICR
jgi:hypothetical protein